MLSLLLALAVAGAPAQDSTHLIIVATTDVHGRTLGWDYVGDSAAPGGLARVASLLDSLRARYPGRVIAVDAGDLIQGDPFATYFGRVAARDPHPVVEALNLAGYDAATPGNHEFDFGLPTMRRALAGAAFPYVSANLFAARGDTLLYRPFVVLPRAQLRVGIVGFTTSGVMLWNARLMHGQARVAPIESVARQALEGVRRESDLTVALIHSGMDGPASYDTTGVGAENAAATLAAASARPDLVIVGHSHREMRDSVINGVHFVQPRPYASQAAVVRVDLDRRNGRWRVTRIASELVSTAQRPPAHRVLARLAGEHRAVREWAATPLGEAVAAMPAAAARAEATPIVDFVNATQRRRAGADLSATPAFNLKAGFDSGEIRLSHLLALYPYENTLRAVRISGAQLREYLEHSARYYLVSPLGHVTINDSVPGYNFDIVGGARYEIDLRQPVGSRIRNLRVDGRPVQPTDSFTLALNSYRQTGAGGYRVLRGAPVVYDRGEDVRELLVSEVRTRRRIDPKDYAENGWRIVPPVLAQAVAALHRLPGPPPPPSSPKDSVLLRVLSMTDLHGRLEAAPALKYLMDSLAAACGCPTLRVDAGDQMQGTIISNRTAGRATVDVLNRLGLAAAAIGNHELDWSVDTLRRRIAEARYAWLAANIFDSTTGRPADWATPYRIFQVGGHRVAVIGYITANTKSMVKRDKTAGLRFGEGALALNPVLRQVEAERPDLTLVLAHAGAVCNATTCSGEVIRLAEELPRESVDLIVAGHTHRRVNIRVDGVPIVEAGSEGKALGVADVVRTSAGGREIRTRIVEVPPGRFREDRGVAEVVERYRRQADSIASRVVTEVKFPLVRGERALGGLVAEARRNHWRADVGLVNNSGIRADLPGGRVTYGELYAIQPFQNDIVRVTLTGEQLLQVLEHALGDEGRPRAAVSGATVRYDPRRRPGQRIRAVVFEDGRKLKPKGSYTLATDDFLAGGGDGYDMLARLPAERSGTLDVDALAAYLRRLRQPVEVADRPGFVSTRP